jgi:hypothetical protein
MRSPNVVRVYTQMCFMCVHPQIEQQITFFSTHDLNISTEFYEQKLGLELWLDQGSCRIYTVNGSGYLGLCQASERLTRSSAGLPRRTGITESRLYLRCPPCVKMPSIFPSSSHLSSVLVLTPNLVAATLGGT